MLFRESLYFVNTGHKILSQFLMARGPHNKKESDPCPHDRRLFIWAIPDSFIF